MKILVFPYDKNPYQRLLYQEVKKLPHIKIKYGWFLPYIGAMHMPLYLLLCRISGYKIVHIHWIAFYTQLSVPYQKKISWYSTLFAFWWMKLLDFKIVWTMHDIVPHEQETTDDLEISKRFAKITSAKIFHSKNNELDALKQGLTIGKKEIIPIGPYDIYPHNTNFSDARRKLGIKETSFVILFFGLIRPYKGLEDLLAAYRSLNHKDIVLVIAGKSADDILFKQIDTLPETHRVIYHDTFIDDNQVAKYFEAADVVCLPFRKITTSSTVLLAMAFKKPIVAPRIGSLTELPESVGFFYTKSSKDGLLKALEQAYSQRSKLNARGQSAYRYSQTISWESNAAKTYELYESLFDDKT